MNTFVNAVVNTSQLSRTENGDVTYNTAGNACVDLFFQGAASRAAPEAKVKALFAKAYGENPDVAARIALYVRDIRGGQGERRVFRTFLQYLEQFDTERLLRMIPLIPVLGRWDDLFSVVNTDRTAKAVFGLYAEALRNGNALAAKWAPREKADRQLAARLRGALGIVSWKAYRSLIAQLSDTVEQDMCARDWEKIVYSHVPSVASARYAKSFFKHDADRYKEYLDAVRSGGVDKATGKVAKINTGAVYPYDIVKSGVNDLTADTMWNNLPDFVPEGTSFIPVIDVSGSMESGVGGSTTCLDVAISLGMYVAERNKSAFKNLGMTFSTNPRWFTIPQGDIRTRYSSVYNSDRRMEGSTDLDKAFNLILDTAQQGKVSQDDMPSTLIVMSDMEFNGGFGGKTVAQRTKDAFRNAGYKLPNIVWWNIQSRNDSTPVKYDENGMALVSGFSPSIMMNLLGGNMTPEKIMLEAVMKDRYAH